MWVLKSTVYFDSSPLINMDLVYGTINKRSLFRVFVEWSSQISLQTFSKPMKLLGKEGYSDNNTHNPWPNIHHPPENKKLNHTIDIVVGTTYVNRRQHFIHQLTYFANEKWLSNSKHHECPIPIQHRSPRSYRHYWSTKISRGKYQFFH